MVAMVPLGRLVSCPIIVIIAPAFATPTMNARSSLISFLLRFHRNIESLQ